MINQRRRESEPWLWHFLAQSHISQSSYCCRISSQAAIEWSVGKRVEETPPHSLSLQGKESLFPQLKTHLKNPSCCLSLSAMSLVPRFPTHPLERVELYCSSVGLKGGCWCYTTPHTKAKPGLQLSKRGEIKSSSKEELTKTWPNELPNR